MSCQVCHEDLNDDAEEEYNHHEDLRWGHNGSAGPYCVLVDVALSLIGVQVYWRRGFQDNVARDEGMLSFGWFMGTKRCRISGGASAALVELTRMAKYWCFLCGVDWITPKGLPSVAREIGRQQGSQQRGCICISFG
jgi:hypothetical protein